MQEPIKLRTIDETYVSPIEINGKAIVTRLIGGYDPDRKKYTLTECLRVGENERRLGEWTLEDAFAISMEDPLNRSPEKLIMEMRNATQGGNILAIVESML